MIPPVLRPRSLQARLLWGTVPVICLVMESTLFLFIRILRVIRFVLRFFEWRVF